MKIKEVKLLQFGSLATDNEEKIHTEYSLSGHFLYPTTICFLENSDKIQGAIGLKFGIEYFIEGYNNHKLIDTIFTCKITHPLLTNPKTGEKLKETIEHKHNYLNEINFDYYCFEDDWEVQKGIWTFQILENNEIKLEKAFEII